MELTIKHYVIKKGKKYLKNCKLKKDRNSYIYFWTNDINEARVQKLFAAQLLSLMCKGKVITYNENTEPKS